MVVIMLASWDKHDDSRPRLGCSVCKEFVTFTGVVPAIDAMKAWVATVGSNHSVRTQKVESDLALAAGLLRGNATGKTGD